MFSIRSRLASVLQPWLLTEPDLETKLGFLRSYGSAKNLRLDVSVLNNQFTDDSTGWCFKEVKVENLSIQISPWSVPGFTVEVHGVYVILGPRESIDEEGLHHMQSSFARSDVEKKKILSVIDSEGTALHDIIERISAVTSAKNQLMTTFMNVILKNCQLQMHDIHLEVQLPVTDGCVACLLKIEEVGLEVEHLDNTCLLAGLIRGLFVLEKETSLVVNASGLEVELKKEEHAKSVFSSVDLFTCIKLKDLQLLNLEVRATQLEIAFCPVDIATFLLFDTLSSKEVKHCRTGRELWNIAANRIGSLTSIPMLSLHKAVDFVGLWLRHVRAYESLLLLIGYPAEAILRRTAVRMSHDKKFLTHMKQQWKVISEIEKGLPVEALASARRVARYRAAMCVQHSQRINSEPPVQVHNTFIWKILSVLSFIWKHLCWIFQSVVCLFFVRDSLNQHQELDDPSGVVSEVFLSQYSISLELGKISITVYPINEVRPAVGGNSESYTGSTHLNLLSFCMVVEAFFLTYTVGTTVQSLSLSCGDFKVKSSSSSVATLRERNLRNDSNRASRRRRKEKIHDSKAVIWSEPASQFLFLDKVVTGSVSSTGNFWFLHLENYLAEMWSNWKRIRKKLKGSKAQYLESPFILCEITSFLRDPCLHMPNSSGLWRCCLTLGKLNIDLGYSSIMSVVLLLRQIQHTLSWNANRRTRVSSNSPSTIGEPKEIKWEDYFESYTSRMKMAMLRMIPEKNIQVGVAIAGPTIRVSLQEEALLIPKEKDVHPIFTQGHGDSFFAFDLGNIELAVWPTQETHLAALTGGSRVDKVGNEPLLVKEPLSIDIPKSDSFISQGRITLDSCWRINGLNAYLQDLEENRQWQVIVLKSIIIQSSSCKEYLHSFTTNASNLSTSFCGMANGVAALSYMDELWVIFQVVGCVLSTMSYVFTSLDFVGGVQFQEVIRRNNLFSIQDTDGVAQAYEVKAAALILKNTHFTCDAKFDCGPLDIILHNSRKVHIMENCMKFYVASSNKRITFDIPEHGIGVSIQRSRVHLSSKEEDPLKVLIDILGIQAIIFRYQSPTGEYSYDQLIDLYHQSENFSCGVTLSSCTLALSFTSPGDALACGRVNDTVDGSTSGTKSSPAVEDPPAILSDGSNNIQLNGFNQTSEHGRLIASDILAPPSIYPVLINVTIHEIVMAGYSVKNALIGAHQPKRLVSSLSIGREFHSISWEIQGGLVVLETAALATFLRCFNLYLVYITKLSSIIPLWGHLSSGGQSEAVQSGEEIPRPSNNPSKKYAQGTVSSFSQPEPISKYQSLEVLMIRLTDFSLVLVADECGQVWEFLLEVDFHLKLELMNLRRKLLFDNSRLTIRSQRLHDSCAVQIIKDIQVPHFLSATFSELSSISVSGDLTLPFRQTKGLLVFGYTYSSGSPASQKESTVDDDISGCSRFDHRNNILKHAAASLMVEKAAPGDEVGFLRLKDDWVGVGSVSGLDLTISLSEIQMLLSLLQPLSVVSSVESTVNSIQKQYSSIRASNSGSEEDTVSSNSGSEDTVPDGAVVAIQDIQQHMFFAVEYSEDKYRLAGTIHYSLVGERSLFRVKYCDRKRWGVPVPWFTLISLHAKSRSGEPLQLNYHRGSGFVDISSTDNNDWALWRTLPYNPESYEGDSDLESYMQSSKNTFYLVNKKCDCAVAFVDGVPEFVKKPGNPFKMKVFHDVCVARDPLILGTPSGGDCETDLRQNREIDEGNTSSRRSSNFPYVNITIEKVSLTIVHEVSNASNKFQLVQGCINDIHFMVQVLPSKLRLISTFTAVVFHFDAQNNLWREVVQPVEMCIYYRSRLASEDLEIAPRGMPVHFYFRSKQVDVYVTELSLDILLFMVGELNLAGPYAVRSSMIFANCCKVENLSGLNLRCHFNDDQDVTIAGRQSASIFLRHAAVASQLPESSSVVSVQLVVLGAFSTSPIHVSLLNAQVLAWRTRVVSLQDSKTSPGPFVVVDIFKKTEDGLSIVVSPLLRIHNETGFSMELRFRRPQQKESESASAVLRAGDTIDDSMIALDAMDLCGGSKKALMSLNLGNFLFSFRPVIKEFSGNTGEPVAIEWSEDLKGGKAVRLSGIFDKLTYKVKRAFKVESLKYSFSTVQCSLSVEGAHLTDVHFLIQTIGRNVPVKQPENFRDIDTMPSPVALQEQKEIFLLPTVHVSNFLQSEIHVLITETHPGNSSTFRSPTCVIMSLLVKRLSADQCTPGSSNHTGKEATIPCGSSASLYGNPTMIYFTVTLTAFSSSCKPVNSGDWVKKLHKQKHNVHYLDIDLDFGGGKYFASLRLLRGDRGILEAAVFTSYTLHNDSDLTLFCFSSNLKPLSRMEADKFGSSLPPERGLLLPPKITRSWFLKSNRVQLVLLEEKASVALLDLDALSRFTELCLEVDDGAGVRHITKLGVSLKPRDTNVAVPSQTVTLVPRYVLSNESQESIILRQCYLEDDRDGIVAVNSKKKTALHMKSGPSKKREIGFVDSLFRKHRNTNEDSLMFIQFCLNEVGWSWSGPICVASLGRFFLKFRRPLDSLGQQSNLVTGQENKLTEFAVVHIVEEGSTLVLRFHSPPNIRLPYRIENFLCYTITYYQKESVEPEVLGSGGSANYVWDDLNLPHKLVVHIPDMRLSREINMDKVCRWKPFSKVRQNRGLALRSPLDKKPEDRRRKDESHGLEMLKVGYEVYADGSTRVLRISEFPDSDKEVRVFQPCAKIQLRVSVFSVHLLEHGKQDEDASETSSDSTLIVARLGNINLDSISTDRKKFNQIRIQSLNVDEKWAGAPFAAMLRRNQLDYSDANGNILQIVFVLLSTDSNVKQVTYSSIVLQPVNLSLDEETLMRLVPFWRTSLSESNIPSQQFYFEHFEIHPIKIVASFLPGRSDSSYTSAQETLRSLLHSVIKIPTVKNMDVELNGILVTHALVTVRELLIKCAQHYSWYAMRAIYIAKGSPLLPPSFASIFDDSASSSLDVFFDPSSGSINLPGITLGMFKFISKCVRKKGFSGTKRYFGDLGKTVKTAGSNVLFAAVTEISDCILRGAETNGFNGMMNGFHQGILKLAMEPSLLGSAVMEGGPDRKIKLDRNPGVDELYIEGYLQAMLDAIYKQEYLRVRVIENQVILKNLPPNTSLINEIMERVKSFLISKALLKGELPANSHYLHHLRGDSEWKIGPTILTLCEHLFVSFSIRMLRKQAGKVIAGIKQKAKSQENEGKAIVPASVSKKLNMKRGIGKFVFSGMLAYVDGRLCRCIPNAIVRRIVSGFLLSFLDKSDND